MNGSSTIIDNETRAYQEETASIRFRQNLIHGIGAATVFGAATGLFGFLIKVATGEVALKTVAAVSANAAAPVTAAAASTFLGLGVAGWAIIGIAAAVAIGFGCLYASSRLASQLVRIEQDHHAKQIAKGINGKTQEMEQQKPVPFPAQDKPVEAPATTTLQSAANDASMNEAQPTVSNVKLDDKVVSLDEARKARMA